MSKAFIIVGILALTQLTRIDCFNFIITRSLNSTEALKINWCYVEVTETILSESNTVKVKVAVPSTLPYSEPALMVFKTKAFADAKNQIIKAINFVFLDIFIFFANDVKEILQVSLSEMVKGKFYEAPYKLVKESDGEETTVTDESDDFQVISGEFPFWWLPKNCTKISATVIDTGGIYYNYYGIQNFKISFPDLMVVEEFKNFK